MSRAKTAEDLREDLFDGFDIVARYWSRVDGISERDRCRGVVHSVLCMIDGVSSSLPYGVELVARTHPEDKEYDIKNGDNWVEDGATINNQDGYLHDLWGERWK